MKTYRIPMAEVRSQLDPNKGKVMADWRKREPTVNELWSFVQQARNELLEMEELKTKLQEALRANKMLEHKVTGLTEQNRKLNALQNENASVEMKLRAAEALGRTRLKTIRVK